MARAELVAGAQGAAQGKSRSKGSSRGKLLLAIVLLAAAGGVTAWQVSRMRGNSKVEGGVADRAQDIQNAIQASSKSQPVADQVAPPSGGVQKSPGRGPSQVGK